jgi:hypothetical protein
MNDFEDLVMNIEDNDIKNQHRGIIGIRKILSEAEGYKV